MKVVVITVCVMECEAETSARQLLAPLSLFFISAILNLRVQGGVVVEIICDVVVEMHNDFPFFSFYYAYYVQGSFL